MGCVFSVVCFASLSFHYQNGPLPFRCILLGLSPGYCLYRQLRLQLSVLVGCVLVRTHRICDGLCWHGWVWSSTQTAGWAALQSGLLIVPCILCSASCVIMVI